MTIHHVTFSSTGGAGVVAKLLVEGQHAIGLESILHKQTGRNLWDEPFRFPILTLKSAIDHFVISNRSEGSQLSLTRKKLNAKLLKKLKPDDILHLHWVTGMVDSRLLVEMSKRVKKVIWTLHDMEPFTGGCHQSGKCNLHENACYPCPLVRQAFKGAIKLNLESKTASYNEVSNLEIVAPTNWMANRAMSSHAFGNKPVRVIENPISEIFFKNDSTKLSIREELGISRDSFVAVFIAADLDNPGKQVHEALDVFLESDDYEVPRLALLFGKTKFNFEKNKRVLVFGSVDSIKLSHFAKAADLHISMSKAESAGLTIAETAALGIMSIVKSDSGMKDMVFENVTGHVVQDFDELRDIVNSMATNKIHVEKLSKQAKEFAEKHFQLATSTKKYLDLYCD